MNEDLTPSLTLMGAGETPGTKYGLGGTVTDALFAWGKMGVGTVSMAYGVAVGLAALYGAELYPPCTVVTIPYVIGWIYGGWAAIRSGMNDLNKISEIQKRRNYPRVPELRESPSRVPQLRELQ